MSEMEVNGRARLQALMSFKNKCHIKGKLLKCWGLESLPVSLPFGGKCSLLKTAKARALHAIWVDVVFFPLPSLSLWLMSPTCDMKLWNHECSALRCWHLRANRFTSGADSDKLRVIVPNFSHEIPFMSQKLDLLLSPSGSLSSLPVFPFSAFLPLQLLLQHWPPPKQKKSALQVKGLTALSGGGWRCSRTFSTMGTCLPLEDVMWAAATGFVFSVERSSLLERGNSILSRLPITIAIGSEAHDLNSLPFTSCASWCHQQK